MNEVTTLLLAWKMAIIYNCNESDILYKTALNLWSDVKDKKLQHLFIQISLKDTSNKERVNVAKQIEKSYYLLKDSKIKDTGMSEFTGP